MHPTTSNTASKLDEWLDESAQRLVDATLRADLGALEAFIDDASRARRSIGEKAGQLSAFVAVADWATARLAPQVAAGRLTAESAESRVLRFVAGAPQCTSTELVRALSLATETVSRAGTTLEADGLVIRSRAGKYKFWQLTPAGKAALGLSSVDYSTEDGTGEMHSTQRQDHAAEARLSLLSTVLAQSSPAQPSGQLAEPPVGDLWLRPHMHQHTSIGTRQ